MSVASLGMARSSTRKCLQPCSVAFFLQKTAAGSVLVLCDMLLLDGLCSVLTSHSSVVTSTDSVNHKSAGAACGMGMCWVGPAVYFASASYLKTNLRKPFPEVERRARDEARSKEIARRERMCKVGRFRLVPAGAVAPHSGHLAVLLCGSSRCKVAWHAVIEAGTA